jgi:hypothetical protein
VIFVAALAICAAVGFGKDEEIDFYGYVDSDVCSRLYMGPIDAKRVECTKTNYKEGDSLVVTRFRDNSVFEPHKQKHVKKQAGEAVRAAGKANLDKGRIKIASIEVVQPEDVPKVEFGMWQGREKADPKVWEAVRHTLAMMPYISVFDFISFAMIENDVILTGWTVRDTNRGDAYRRVKRVEGVEHVTNNIMVLPLGSFDMDIRAQTRAVLQQVIPRYFWASGSTVRIVVNNGRVILLGTVNSKADSDMAYIRARGVPMVFGVFNMLRVVTPEERDKG